MHRKCSACGSEWNTPGNTSEVKACPFCGKLLVQKSRSQTFGGVLATIRDQLGKESLRNGKMLAGTFRDLAPELHKEHLLIDYLVQSGVLADLYDASQKNEAEQSAAVGRAARIMEDKTLISPELALRTCRTYLDVVCGRDPDASRPEEPPKKNSGTRKKTPPVQPEPEPEWCAVTNGELVAYLGGEVTVHVPAQVHSIGIGAFSGRPFVREVILPEGLQTICAEAFRDCTGLESIRIPSTVTRIDDYAFAGCTSLKTISWGRSRDSIHMGRGVFSGCPVEQKATGKTGAPGAGKTGTGRKKPAKQQSAPSGGIRIGYMVLEWLIWAGLFFTCVAAFDPSSAVIVCAAMLLLVFLGRLLIKKEKIGWGLVLLAFANGFLCLGICDLTDPLLGMLIACFSVFVSTAATIPKKKKEK